MPRIISAIKSRVVPAGKKPRTVKFGAFQGLQLYIDLRYQSQMWLGLGEREVFAYLRAFTSLARCAIDVGAADGEYTLYYLSNPRMQRVFAFDPSERFPRDLQANLALNGFGDDERLSVLKQYVGKENNNTMRTLDSLDGYLQGPCVIKVDVDGGEGQVLEGATQLLARRDLYWLIETHTADLEKTCDAMLRSAGLETAIINNAWWRKLIPEYRPIEHNRWLAAWSLGSGLAPSPC